MYPDNFPGKAKSYYIASTYCQPVAPVAVDKMLTGNIPNRFTNIYNSPTFTADVQMKNVGDIYLTYRDDYNPIIPVHVFIHGFALESNPTVAMMLDWISGGPSNHLPPKTQNYGYRAAFLNVSHYDTIKTTEQDC